jgi:glycine/D-amino acid oxidase-like deaminating enzyme
VRSFWLEQALGDDRSHAPALDGDIEADVAIVGGGYAGMWSALRLKESDPNLDVVLLEADICGAGASGRNGGLVVDLWPKFPTIEALCGTDEALRLCRASAAAIDEIGAFTKAHGFDADFRKTGYLWGATCKAQAGSWDAHVETLQHRQVRPVEIMDGPEITERWGLHGHVGAVFDPSQASIQPAKLARGLRAVVLEKGVRIFERSPMTKLHRARPPRVETARGTVTAAKVVLAINAWSLSIPELAPAIVVIGAEMAVTDPVPDQLARMGWLNGPMVSDSRAFVGFYSPTAEGRVTYGRAGVGLAFGSRIGAQYEGPSPRLPMLRRIMAEVSPEIAALPVATSWRGPVDRTKDGLPYFGTLSGCSDVVYAYGFSGNGIVPCFLGSNIVASLVLGRDDVWARSGLVRPVRRNWPPEPIRYLGGNLVLAALARMDRLQHQGRTVDPLTRALVRFVPEGFKAKQTGRNSTKGAKR